MTYCTEASNEKSKYAYRKIFFYKKALSACLLSVPRARPPFWRRYVSYRLVVKIVRLKFAKKRICNLLMLTNDNSFQRIRAKLGIRPCMPPASHDGSFCKGTTAPDAASAVGASIFRVTSARPDAEGPRDASKHDDGFHVASLV